VSTLPNQQVVSRGLNHFWRNKLEIVRIEDPFDLSKEPSEQPEVASCHPDQRAMTSGAKGPSQGLTEERVLVNMDTDVHPELISGRFAYLSVSRASHDAQIYTNNAATLGQSLSHEVNKASAIDFGKVQSPIPTQGFDQARGFKGNAAGLGLSL